MTPRRPTRVEADALILELADRMERVATELERKPGGMDPHRLAGHVGYMRSEASNLRSFVRREPRLLSSRLRQKANSR